MTLATCEAISKHGAIDPAVIATTLADWFKNGKITGMGAATFQALSGLSRGGHWALVGRKGEMAAGNGAAMRIAPLAFCLDPGRAAARTIIRDVCRITHHSDEAYIGALAVATAIGFAWDGIWTGGPDLLRSVMDIIPDSRVRERLIEFEGMSNIVPLPEVAERFGCSAYIVESVPFVLFAAQRVG
jgi:ADP-ribosyl-[dinitrogen reductase] hydrolase